MDRKENIVLNVSAVDYMKYVDNYTSAVNLVYLRNFLIKQSLLNFQMEKFIHLKIIIQNNKWIALVLK